MYKKSIIALALSVFVLLFASCDSPTAVSEKALKVVGKGTFSKSMVDKIANTKPLAVISMFTDYGNIFDGALEETEEALNYRKTGVYKDYSDVMFDFSDVLFERFELIDKTDYSTDCVYDIFRYTGYVNGNIDDNALRDIFSKHEDYQETNNIGTWLDAKDLPTYSLRYKLDNKFIAYIITVKIPHEGWRVCSFRIE